MFTLLVLSIHPVDGVTWCSRTKSCSMYDVLLALIVYNIVAAEGKSRVY